MNENESMNRTIKCADKEMKPRKRRRVTDAEYEILKPGEQELLHSRNYRVTQLKDMCRFYKLRLSGNKNELTKRVHSHLYFSKYANIIQRNVRKYLLNSYLKAKGPAFIKRKLCVNDSDFFTMEAVNEISHEQFISYKDVDNMVYGFDMLSLHNMIAKSSPPYKNPYNRNVLPDYLIQNCKKIERLSSFFGETSHKLRLFTGNSFSR